MYEVVKLISDVILLFLLSSLNYPPIIVEVLISSEVTSETPHIRENVQLTQEVSELRRILLGKVYVITEIKEKIAIIQLMT